MALTNYQHLFLDEERKLQILTQQNFQNFLQLENHEIFVKVLSDSEDEEQLIELFKNNLGYQENALQNKTKQKKKEDKSLKLMVSDYINFENLYSKKQKERKGQKQVILGYKKVKQEEKLQQFKDQSQNKGNKKPFMEGMKVVEDIRKFGQNRKFINFACNELKAIANRVEKLENPTQQIDMLLKELNKVLLRVKIQKNIQEKFDLLKSIYKFANKHDEKVLKFCQKYYDQSNAQIADAYFVHFQHLLDYF